MRLGAYEVRGELGRGGLAVVYRGLAPDGREVAIKVLKKATGDALLRFERERRLSSILGEAGGFVPILEAGESSEGPFLVMPLLEGGTLRDRFARGALAIESAVELASALASALARAHALGIVHRDLKPENVLFNRSGQPLVADLGLGKHVRDDTPGASQSIALTSDGQSSGTYGYMAPEQMSNVRDAGPPADVFALGAILYEALAGSPAFEAATLIELMARTAEGRFTPLRSRRPGVPSWLESVVAKTLAPEPTDRFPDAAAFAAALEARGKDAKLSRRALGLGALASLVVLAALGAVTARAQRPPGPLPIDSWERAVEALASGETDVPRLRSARPLLEDATRPGSAGQKLDLVLHALDQALERAPDSPDLRRAHARARARLELDVPVSVLDLEALGHDHADLADLEALSRQAIAAGWSGSRTVETARELAKSDASSRPLAALLALALFQTGDSKNRVEGLARLEQAHPGSGKLRVLRDTAAAADRAAALLSRRGASLTELEELAKSLASALADLATHGLAPSVKVALEPLCAPAHSVARAMKFGAEEKPFAGQVFFEKLAAVAIGRGEAPDAVEVTLEIAGGDRENLTTPEEASLAKERKFALARRLEPVDPVLAAALLEYIGSRTRLGLRQVPVDRDPGEWAGWLEHEAERTLALAKGKPADDLDATWAMNLAHGMLQGAANECRRTADAPGVPPEVARRWIERALVDNRRGLAVARMSGQLGLEVSRNAMETLEDLIRLDRDEGLDDLLTSLDGIDILRAEVSRRFRHDPERAIREVADLAPRTLGSPRRVMEPILALAEADLGHFDSARKHLARAAAEQATLGETSWGPFRTEAVRDYIAAAEKRARPSR